jgi:HPt (histidine-containing phosphotransfer) domain-containing protein
LRYEELREILAKWLAGCHATGSDASGQPASNESLEKPADNLIDSRALDSIRSLQREGAPDILHKIIGVFLESTPNLLGELQHAIETGSGEDVYRLSHTLKSSSATVGAMQISAICREIETLARAGDLSEVAGQFQMLQTVYPQTELALAKILREVA